MVFAKFWQNVKIDPAKKQVEIMSTQIVGSNLIGEFTTKRNAKPTQIYRSTSDRNACTSRQTKNKMRRRNSVSAIDMKNRARIALFAPRPNRNPPPIKKATVTNEIVSVYKTGEKPDLPEAATTKPTPAKKAPAKKAPVKKAAATKAPAKKKEGA